MRNYSLLKHRSNYDIIVVVRIHVEEEYGYVDEYWCYPKCHDGFLLLRCHGGFCIGLLSATNTVVYYLYIRYRYLLRIVNIYRWVDDQLCMVYFTQKHNFFKVKTILLLLWENLEEDYVCKPVGSRLKAVKDLSSSLVYFWSLTSVC